MKKSATKLYDSITDLDERYLLEAEQFQPGAGGRRKTWAGLAAAIVLAVGVGAGLPGMAGAADDSAPEANGSDAWQENVSFSQVMDSSDAVLRGGELRLDSGETYLILEEVDPIPKGDEPKEEELRYLEWVDGRYVLREGPTDLVIFPGPSEGMILRDGEHYYSLQKKD